jgi:hypothetical protein
MTDTTSKNKTTKSEKPTRFVVIRDRKRVSELEYVTQEQASTEYSYWQGIASKWDPSSRVEILEKDNRIHRVY